MDAPNHPDACSPDEPRQIEADALISNEKYADTQGMARTRPTHTTPPAPPRLTEKIALIGMGISVLSLVILVFHNWWGPDFWYHLFLGRGIWTEGTLQPGDNLEIQQPSFINNYWLFQAPLYASYWLGGYWGVHFFFLAIWLGTVAFWMRSSCSKKTPAESLLFLLTFIFLCQLRIEFRPESVTYLMLTAELWFLLQVERDQQISRSGYVGWTLLHYVWANSHGYSMLGIAIVGWRYASSWIGPFSTAERNRFGILLAISVVVSLLPPWGPALWWNFFHMYSFLNSMKGQIEEFIPPSHPVYLRMWCIWWFWGAWFYTSLAIVLALLHPTRAKNFFWIGLSLLASYLSFRHYRNVPFLPLLCGVLWSRTAFSLREIKRWRMWIDMPYAPLAFSALALTMLISIPSGRFYWWKYSEARTGIAPSPKHFPIHFANYIKKYGFKGRLFNEPSDGGYLEFHFPELRLYGDSRFVDVEPVMKYFRATVDIEPFKTLSKDKPFDGVLLWILRNQRLIHALLKDPEWRLAYHDFNRAFFVRVGCEECRHLPNWPGNYAPLNDWTDGDNLARASQWAMFFIDTNRMEDMKNLLRSFDSAPTAPVRMAEIGMRYSLQTQDKELAAIARSLAAKVDWQSGDRPPEWAQLVALTTQIWERAR